MTIYSTVSERFTSLLVLHCDYDLPMLPALEVHSQSPAECH